MHHWILIFSVIILPGEMNWFLPGSNTETLKWNFIFGACQHKTLFGRRFNVFWMLWTSKQRCVLTGFSPNFIRSFISQLFYEKSYCLFFFCFSFIKKNLCVCGHSSVCICDYILYYKLILYILVFYKNTWKEVFYNVLKT